MKTKTLLNVVSTTLAGLRTNDKDKQNLLFKDGHLYSWSAAISVSALLPEDAKDLTGVINGVDLVNFLSKLRAEDITIACEDTYWTITTEDMSASINSRNDTYLAERVSKLETKHNWKALPEGFYEGLALCDIPYNTYKVNGVYIGGDTILATDNRRVNRAYMKSEITTPVLLSSFSISEIRKLSIKFTEYAISDKWMYFRCMQDGQEEIVFACNRLDDSAYDNKTYSSFIDKALNSVVAKGKLPKLNDALSLAQCFDEVFDTGRGEVLCNIISLKFNRKNIIVSSERGASGKFSQKIAYPDSAELDIEEALSIKVTSAFLQEALARTNNFALCKVGNKSVLVFTGDTFASVVQVFNN